MHSVEVDKFTWNQNGPSLLFGQILTLGTEQLKICETKKWFCKVIFIVLIKQIGRSGKANEIPIFSMQDFTKWKRIQHNAIKT